MAFHGTAHSLDEYKRRMQELADQAPTPKSKAVAELTAVFFVALEEHSAAIKEIDGVDEFIAIGQALAGSMTSYVNMRVKPQFLTPALQCLAKAMIENMRETSEERERLLHTHGLPN